MKKKVILSLMATGVLASALAGCSKPVGKDEGTTKTEGKKEPAVAVKDMKPEEGAKLLLWDNGDSAGEWAKFVAEEFTKKYNVPVEVAEVKHTDASAKLKTDGPAKLGADVFNAAHDHLGTLVSSGLVIPNQFQDQYKDEMLELAYNATSYKDPKTNEKTLYGYPLSVETYAMFYNKNVVKKPAESWDELIKESKKLTDVKANKYGFMFEPGNYYFLHSFVGGYGGYEFGDNGTNPKDIGLNNEGAVKAGKLVQKIHKEILPLKQADITGDVINSLFNEDKLGYKITGPWDIEGLKKAKVDFGVAPLPKLDNGETPKSFSGVKAYYVNAYSKYPKAATLLAQFATSEEMQKKRFEMTGQLPANSVALDDKAITEDPILSAFLEQVKASQPMPSIPEMQNVWASMETAFTTMWNDNTDAQKALDDAVKQIEEGIASQQK